MIAQKTTQRYQILDLVDGCQNANCSQPFAPRYLLSIFFLLFNNLCNACECRYAAGTTQQAHTLTWGTLLRNQNTIAVGA